MMTKRSVPTVHEHPRDATPAGPSGDHPQIFTVDGDALTARGSFHASATLRVTEYDGGALIENQSPEGWTYLTRIDTSAADPEDRETWPIWATLAAVIGWRIRVGSMG